MLALANRANTLFGGDVPIVYECLDIHRLLLRGDAVGKALRAPSGGSAARPRLLITSSPAFIENYFQPFRQIDAPVAASGKQGADARPEDPPAGAAGGASPGRAAVEDRLVRRLALPHARWNCLPQFSRRMDGRFEIVLRGRPAYSEFADFDGFVAAEPYHAFRGAYRNPEDLAAIYGEVHFSWAIDFFEEGLNSSWLLPNRLYEGCRYGAVPIAMRDTETGRFLADRAIGLLLDGAVGGRAGFAARRHDRGRLSRPFAFGDSRGPENLDLRSTTTAARWSTGWPHWPVDRAWPRRPQVAA